MLEFLDYIGLLAFSISGVLTSSNRNLDLLGGYIMAFITALGGGTIRDLLLNTNVAWMQSVTQIAVVGCGATLAIIFRRYFSEWRRTLSIFDTIGIAVFTIVGVEKGIKFEQIGVIAISLGMITATFGGLLRDVLSNEIPLIFRKEIYAVPCLIGGSVLFLGHYFGYGDSPFLIWASILIIVVLRTLAVVYSWRLPLIKEIFK